MPDERLRWHGSAAFSDVICPPRFGQECHDLPLITVPHPGYLPGRDRWSASALLYVNFHESSNEFNGGYVRDGDGNTLSPAGSDFQSHPGAPFGTWAMRAYRIQDAPFPLEIRTAWCHIEQLFAGCDDFAGAVAACIVDEGRDEETSPGRLGMLLLLSNGVLAPRESIDTLELSHDFEPFINTQTQTTSSMMVAMGGCYLGSAQVISSTNGWTEIENRGQAAGSRFARVMIATHDGIATPLTHPGDARSYIPTVHTQQATGNRLGISIWSFTLVATQAVRSGVKSSVQFVG